MLSVSVGPLAVPVAPLLVLSSAWVAASLAGRLAPKDWRVKAESSLWNALWLGLLAARIGYVLQYASAYAATPWALIDLRDGGWSFMTGLLASSLWLLWQARRWPMVRRPAGQAALAGLALWSAGSVAVWLVDQGDARPSLSAVVLADLQTGQTRSLPDVLAGKPTVVNLWATWCGPCRSEMPDLAAAQRQTPDIQFVFVNQGESAQVIQAYLQRSGLNLGNVWIDASRALGPAVGSKGVPTTLFFDARGQRVDAHFGVINAAALQARLRNLRSPK